MWLNDLPLGGESAMKLLKILGFATVLGAAALCSPLAGAFTSGGWQGQANHDDDGRVATDA